MGKKYARWFWLIFAMVCAVAAFACLKICTAPLANTGVQEFSAKALYQILLINLLILLFFLAKGRQISHGMLLLVIAQFVLTHLCMEVYFNNLLAVSQEVYNDTPEIDRLFFCNLGVAAASFLYFFIRLMINSFGRNKGDAGDGSKKGE